MRKLMYRNMETGAETASFAEMKEWAGKVETFLREVEAPISETDKRQKAVWDEMNAPSEIKRKARNKALGF